jgi:hypothetical protein
VPGRRGPEHNKRCHLPDPDTIYELDVRPNLAVDPTAALEAAADGIANGMANGPVDGMVDGSANGSADGSGNGSHRAW